jgi:hypothetical protein
MRRRLPRAWFVAAIAAATPGCWLVAGLEERPLSRNAGPAAPEASADTGGEVIPLDDAATATDAGADSTCSAASLPRLVLCDDFDNGGYRSEWTPTTIGPARLGIVGTPNVSAPFALSAQTTAVAPADNLLARLVRTIAADKTAYSLDARVQFPLATAGGSVQAPIAMQIRLSSELFMLFQVRTKGEAAACTIPGQQLGADVPFTYGEWHRVILRATSTGSGYDFQCDVDGLSRTGSKPNGTGVPPTNAAFQVGIETFSGEAPAKLLFDDVLIDAR